MAHQIIKWLRKPFPQVESTTDILFISVGSGIVVMAILIVLKPFGITDIDRDLFLYLCGYALIDIVITTLYFIIPRIKSSWRTNRHWTTGKSLASVICLLIVIALCNYVYGEFLAGKVYVEGFREIHRGGILSWLFITISVGIIPLVFALYFIERRLLIRNELRAKEFNFAIRDSEEYERSTTISIGSGSDSLKEIRQDDFICIRAEGGNYATVYWEDAKRINKKLIRITLVGFLKQVSHVESIVRCHKSYVINLDRVLSFQGNARSVNVKLKGLDDEVPVSRAFPREKLENLISSRSAPMHPVEH